MSEPRSVSDREGEIVSPSRRAPAPRTASYRVPVAWFTTRAASGSDLVQDADARREPWNASGGVRRPVERIKHREQGTIQGVVAQPRLFAQHPEACVGENSDGGCVGHEVGSVLPRSGAGQAPVDEPSQRAGDRSGRLAEDLKELGTVHSTEP